MACRRVSLPAVLSADGHCSTRRQSLLCAHRSRPASYACGGGRATPLGSSGGRCVHHASDKRLFPSRNPDARPKFRKNCSGAGVCSFPWEGSAGEDVVTIVASDANRCNLCLPPAGNHGHLLPVRLCLLRAGARPYTVASSPALLVVPQPARALGPSSRVRRTQKMKVSRFTMSLVITLLITASLSAQNVVVQWNAIASTTIITNAKEASVASGAWFAYVHLAVFDAVNAIDNRFQPYLFTENSPAGATTDATAHAAAHRVLVTYFPSQQTGLDAQFATSVAAISDTPANISAGLAVGDTSAQALITARANDGLLANVPYTPPVGPGFWLPTPPAFGPPLTPWLSQMVPFTMSGAAQFFPDEGPDALDSQQWIDDYTQVRTLGALNSTVRTPQQTEIALFWPAHTGQQYPRAFPNLSTQKEPRTSATAPLT